MLLYPKSDSRGNTRRISSRRRVHVRSSAHTHTHTHTLARRNGVGSIARRLPFPSPFLVFSSCRASASSWSVLLLPPLERRPRRSLAFSLARSPSGANPACTFVCLNWVAFYARASNVNRILNYYSDCVSPSPRRYLLPVAS